jgi:hypothetical protein
MTLVFSHAVVLNATLESWVKPLVKDKKGNMEASDNYRGITLSSIWAKIVDKLLLKKIEEVAKTSDYQFGFKKGVSTKIATKVLVEVGKHFIKKGGSLFCVFIDIRKAFDRLRYDAIWEKLEKIEVGKNVVSMIVEQYRHQSRKVVWGEDKSKDFKVGMGVRQGSPLSPMLFALVLDEVIDEIQRLRVGCIMRGIKCNILVYADDIVILGPSQHAVQEIVNVLARCLEGKGLEINIGKTVAMEIKEGRKRSEAKEIKINGQSIKWVTEFKFLGTWIQHDLKWDAQLRMVHTKMNKLGNTVLHQFGRLVQDLEKVKLLETCAFDLYGVEFCSGVGTKRWNDIGRSYHWLIKRALSKNKRSSNHEACAEGKGLTWELVTKWRKVLLWENLGKSENKLVKKLFGKRQWKGEYGNEIREILMDYGKDCMTARDLKKRMKLYVEAVAAIKEAEKEEASRVGFVASNV